MTYDVADDKRRTKLFEFLKGYGDHAQFSVFFCILDKSELATVRSRADAIIHHREDQVLIVDLGPGDNPLESSLDCLGKPYEPPAQVFIV